jgi:co-chaperonin GroES (HSP10)
MFLPLRDRVVVKTRVRKLSDVIIVNNKEPFNEGTVVAIGPKVRETKVGDFVKYGNGDYLNWPTHSVNGEDFQIIQEGDIACVVD